MSMKALEELRERMCDELREYNHALKNQPKEMNAGTLEHIHRLTDTIKNIDKIIMLEDGGHSHGDWEARGTYGDDSSYAHRNMHYVRGHYSHDGEMSERRDRYSHDSGKDHMISELREMLHDATTEKERSAIRRCIEHIEEG
ncbi:MAG: hypothetical protein K2N06_05605 [Oscillospiraceae bacterium]|nr:hypothetical protein [Oscillospiraceae bacterium]